MGVSRPYTDAKVIRTVACDVCSWWFDTEEPSLAKIFRECKWVRRGKKVLCDACAVAIPAKGGSRGK